MIDLHTPVWTDGLAAWSEDRIEGMAHGICYMGGDDPPPAQPQEVKQTTSNLPEYAQPYYERIMGRAEAESNQPYTAYNGQRVADFGADTQNAFDMTRQAAGQGLGGLDKAMGYTNGAMNNRFDANAAQFYMSPYISNVLDQTTNRMNKNFSEQQAGRDSAAVKAGAFGGSRAAITTMQAQRDNNDSLNEMIARQLQSGYENAQKQFNTDEARGLDAAKQLAMMQGQQRELSYQDIDRLMKVGQMQDDKTQRGLDVAYNDFVNQRDYEKNQIAYLSGIMHGATPSQVNSDVSTYKAEPTNTAQLLGMGVAGLGLAK